jgi:hypothetical protein
MRRGRYAEAHAELVGAFALLFVWYLFGITRVKHNQKS